VLCYGYLPDTTRPAKHGLPSYVATIRVHRALADELLAVDGLEAGRRSHGSLTVPLASCTLGGRQGRPLFIAHTFVWSAERGVFGRYGPGRACLIQPSLHGQPTIRPVWRKASRRGCSVLLIVRLRAQRYWQPQTPSSAMGGYNTTAEC